MAAFITPPSGQGLVIPFLSAVCFFFVFYPAVRTGSSNTRLLFGGHLPQTCYFRHLSRACQKKRVKYSTMKYKHFSAVLVYFTNTLEKLV